MHTLIHKMCITNTRSNNADKRVHVGNNYNNICAKQTHAEMIKLV